MIRNLSFQLRRYALLTFPMLQASLNANIHDCRLLSHNTSVNQFGKPGAMFGLVHAYHISRNIPAIFFERVLYFLRTFSGQNRYMVDRFSGFPFRDPFPQPLSGYPSRAALPSKNFSRYGFLDDVFGILFSDWPFRAEKNITINLRNYEHSIFKVRYYRHLSTFIRTFLIIRAPPSLISRITVV